MNEFKFGDKVNDGKHNYFYKHLEPTLGQPQDKGFLALAQRVPSIDKDDYDHVVDIRDLKKDWIKLTR